MTLQNFTKHATTGIDQRPRHGRTDGRTAETKKKKSLLFFLSLFLSVFLSSPRRLGEILCANNRLAPGLTSAFQAQRTCSCFTCHAINHPPSHVTPASPVFSSSFFFLFTHSKRHSFTRNSWQSRSASLHFPVLPPPPSEA